MELQKRECDAGGLWMKLLIIEDDTGLNRGISFAMEQEGYAVVSARTLREGEALFAQEKPDAVILDLNLPDGDGLDFCKKVRQRSGTEGETVILMLTARDLETDEIMGLTSGADDYMTKPFAIEELLARIRLILKKRSGSISSDKNLLTCGELTMDVKRYEVHYGADWWS